MIPLARYRPDIAALKAGKPKVVVAIGEQSSGQPIHQMSLAVANKLETAPELFPGDHMGFEPYAEAFAQRLRQVFAAA